MKYLLCMLFIFSMRLYTGGVLQEQFDKSLARLATKEADLSKSYTDDNSDDESGGDDLASELARAEEAMLGQSPTRAVPKDIDTSAVAQAAAAKALAKRKQASTNGDPRSAMLAAIASRKRPEETDICPPSVDNDTQPAAEEDPMMANPVDPRSSMLSAIRARKVDKKSNDEAKEKNEPINQGGRAALMASIQAQRSPAVDEVNDAQAQDPRSTT